MSSARAGERDKAIAEFFTVLTGLVKLCEPLVKDAVDESPGLKERRRSIARYEEERKKVRSK